MRQGRSDTIDGLRGVAVLAVVLRHGLPGDLGWVGLHGVDLFFVLSGYCLSLPFLGGRPLNYLTFLWHRILRIGPPFWTALTLFFVLGLTSFGLPTAPDRTVTATGFFRDFSFTMSVSPPFNTSFWSLGPEARWYLVCPLLIWLWLHSRITFFAFLVGCYALWIVVPGAPSDPALLACFMLGIVAASVGTLEGAKLHMTWATLGILGALAVSSHATSNADPTWHAVAFLLVLVAPSIAFLRWPPLVALGTASYSVYLVHQPFMASLAFTGVPKPLTIPIGIVIGLIFFRLVEKPSLKAALLLRDARLGPRLARYVPQGAPTR